jgi:hypothetical protein
MSVIVLMASASCAGGTAARRQWLNRALGSHPAGRGHLPTLREASIEDAIPKRTSMPAWPMSAQRSNISVVQRFFDPYL